MSASTKIEWCDSTFNPWMGCTKVSPACDHCYAERDTSRFKTVVWGAGQERKRTSESNWKLPIKWNAEPFYQCECGWRGHDASTAGTALTDGMPSCPVCDSLNLKEARRRVFCASLADVFDNEVPGLWRQHLMSLVADTPNLDWLFLTKRIGNVPRMLHEASQHDGRLMNADDSYRPQKNLWIGATICNQQEADRDIPKLLQVPAAVRFLSIEPLLGKIDLTWCRGEPFNDSFGNQRHHAFNALASRGIHWIIVGGESGPAARPMHPQWVRDLRDQCAAAGVPFLFKQWGEWVDGNNVSKEAESKIWFDKGRTVSDMRDLDLLRDFTPAYPPGKPYFGCSYVIRVGKKAAGRLLDGLTHDGYPEVEA